MTLFRDMRGLAVLALPLALVSLPVWAEEGGAEKGGLPQLDVSLFPEQIFWLAITFALLYALMAGVALPRVAKTQTNRKQVIATEIEAARAANEKAKLTVASVEKSLAEARNKAREHVNEMLAQVGTETASAQSVQEKELLRQLHRAEADIAVTREAALNAIHSDAADLAAVAVEKLVGFKLQVRA